MAYFGMGTCLQNDYDGSGRNSSQLLVNIVQVSMLPADEVSHYAIVSQDMKKVM